MAGLLCSTFLRFVIASFKSISIRLFIDADMCLKLQTKITFSAIKEKHVFFSISNSRQNVVHLLQLTNTNKCSTYICCVLILCKKERYCITMSFSILHMLQFNKCVFNNIKYDFFRMFFLFWWFQFCAYHLKNVFVRFVLILLHAERINLQSICIASVIIVSVGISVAAIDLVITICHRKITFSTKRQQNAVLENCRLASSRCWFYMSPKISQNSSVQLLCLQYFCGHKNSEFLPSPQMTGSITLNAEHK